MQALLFGYRNSQSFTGNFLLSLSPYLTKNIGMGINAIATNPSNELPQPSPRALYMGCPASGTNAPKTERMTVFAAIAEAA